MSVYAVFEPSSLSFSFTVLPCSLVMFLQTLTEGFLYDGVLPEATEAIQNDFNSSIEGCFWNIRMIWLTCQFFAFPKSILNFIYLLIFYHSKVKMFKMDDFEWSSTNLRNYSMHLKLTMIHYCFQLGEMLLKESMSCFPSSTGSRF